MNHKRKTEAPKTVGSSDLVSQTWCNSDHYHCKRCGSVIECCKSLPWKACEGVRRVGVCDCGQILIENEHGKLRWPLRRA
jgi:hypothetical protein